MTSPVYNSTVREYKTVRLWRTKSGFGFSLTGQFPCVLTHVVEGSPAYKAGLKVGDYLIMVNGLNVVKYTHDAVVSMVAGCMEYVILQVAQRSFNPPAVKCTCSMNCQAVQNTRFPVSNNCGVAYTRPLRQSVTSQRGQGIANIDCCGVIYVGFLKLPLPSNPNTAIFTRLLSNSLNHFLLNKNLILMQPLVLTTNRQAISLTDNKNIGYNFILNSVAFIGTIPESPSNMFGLVLHCPPNPICVCHIFSTSLTRQQEQYLRLQPQSLHTAPDLVRYINYLIASVAKNQPLCESSNYNPNALPQPNIRRFRNSQAAPNFEAEIFIDNFQFPVGNMYTVSERSNHPSSTIEDTMQPRKQAAGKPPRCGCGINRMTSNASSTSSANNRCHDRESNNSNTGPSFDARQAAMALARSRSLSRYHRKGFRGGSSRSSGSDDGRFGRGGASSGGSGSFRARYGSQRHRHHKSDRHRRRQDSASGASGSTRFGISDETTTTTSTTTFDNSSLAASGSRRHYGRLWQSGSSSIYRSRSIDSLINASKEEPSYQADSKSNQTNARQTTTFFSLQQQVIIDGPCIQVDQTSPGKVEPSRLALNSLLSPRYRPSYKSTQSEDEIDDEEVAPLAKPSFQGPKANIRRSVSGCYQNSVTKNQNVVIDCKRSPTGGQTESFEPRSSTASVETRTEVAGGSTLSLPMSSASVTTTCRNNAEENLPPATFDALLQDAFALESFRKFLKSQVSDENLEFLLACDSFQEANTNEALASEARAIYRQFISQNSKQPVNLTWQIVASIRRALIAANIRGVSPTNQKELTSPSPDRPVQVSKAMFDSARDHVYRLLKKDCYPRFVQSEFYKELTGENRSTVCSTEYTQSASTSSSGFRSTGLRLSSRRKGKGASSTDSSGAISLASTSSATGSGINWNPAKLISHIIGKAKNKPNRQKSGSSSSQSFRVTFPDGGVETVAIDEMKSRFVASVSDFLGPLCAARGMSVFLCVIFQHGSEQPVDGQLSAASFSGRDLIIEQQTAFVAFHYSEVTGECQSFLVRAKSSRKILDVLNRRDDENYVREVRKLEQDLSGHVNLIQTNVSEVLVRDIQGTFVVVITGNRNQSVNSTSVCSAVKSHFASTHPPKFEDVLNAVTSSHSWHMFDDFGFIDLMKAISPHWQRLRQSLAIIQQQDSQSAEYINAEEIRETPDVVVNEPRSRRPILASTTGQPEEPSAKPFHCRLVRGAHPLSEIVSEQDRGTPSSVDSSFAPDRIIGVNNMNYELIDAHGNIRQTSSRTEQFIPSRTSSNDENSCLMNGDDVSALILNHTHASPYARRMPKSGKISSPDQELYVGPQQHDGMRSSTPSPSTHRLIVEGQLSTDNFIADNAAMGLLTESTL